MIGIIKVCINPHCEEVAHNISIQETRCRNCGIMMVRIDFKTYASKFINSSFQFDYSTKEKILFHAISNL